MGSLILLLGALGLLVLARRPSDGTKARPTSTPRPTPASPATAAKTTTADDLGRAAIALRREALELADQADDARARGDRAHADYLDTLASAKLRLAREAAERAEDA